MLTWKFWKDALERAIKTAAQTAIAGWGTIAITLDGAHWQALGLLVAGATILSVLSSIISSRVGSPKDASLVNEDPAPVQPPTTYTSPAGGVGK